MEQRRRCSERNEIRVCSGQERVVLHFGIFKNNRFIFVFA